MLWSLRDSDLPLSTKAELRGRLPPMTAGGRNFLIGALAFAATLNVTFWLIWSCDVPTWAKLIEQSGGSCPEFWFNRYQTLVAGTAALIGAWITVRASRQHTEESAQTMQTFV